MAAEESRCFASSDTSGANRTAPEEEDGLTTPGPGPREREGEGCAWYQAAVREGVCYSDLLFLLQTPPPPLSESLPPTSLDLCSRLPVPERLTKV